AIGERRKNRNAGKILKLLLPIILSFRRIMANSKTPNIIKLNTFCLKKSSPNILKLIQVSRFVMTMVCSEILVNNQFRLRLSGRRKGCPGLKYTHSSLKGMSTEYL